MGLLAWLGFAPCLFAFVFIRDQQVRRRQWPPSQLDIICRVQ